MQKPRYVFSFLQQQQQQASTSRQYLMQTVVGYIMALGTPVSFTRGLEWPFAHRVPQHGVASAQKPLPCVRSKIVVNTICCYICGRMLVSHADVHYFLTEESRYFLFVFCWKSFDSVESCRYKRGIIL